MPDLVRLPLDPYGLVRVVTVYYLALANDGSGRKSGVTAQSRQIEQRLHTLLGKRPGFRRLRSCVPKRLRANVEGRPESVVIARFVCEACLRIPRLLQVAARHESAAVVPGRGDLL